MGSMMVFASETLPQEPEVASVFWALGAVAAFLLAMVALACWGSDDWDLFFGVLVVAVVFGSGLTGLILWSHSGDVAEFERLPQLEIAANPDAPAEALAALARDPSLEVRRNVAKNPATPDEALAVLAEDSDTAIRLRVAADPSAPDEALRVLAAASDENIRAAVATNPATAATLLETLSEDLSDLVRSCVGANPSAPVSTLARLAGDPDTTVRLAVISNPSAPAEALIEASAHTAASQ